MIEEIYAGSMWGHLKSFGQQGPTQGMNSVISKYKDRVRQALHFFCVPPPSSDYMVDFHRIRFSKNKNHLTHQPKKKGAIIGYLCFKNPNFLYTCSCCKLSASTVAMLQSFWPCGNFQSHHIISTVNYPENWHNLCLRAPLLLVIYSLTFFPWSYRSLHLKF